MFHVIRAACQQTHETHQTVIYYHGGSAMQKYGSVLGWAITGNIGYDTHSLYGNWNPQVQSFAEWSRYRHSEQERKDRKRFIEALLNCTVCDLLDDPQYFKLLMNFHRRFTRKPPNNVVRKWHDEYSREDSEKMVKLIYGKRIHEYPAGHSTPARTSIDLYSDRKFKDVRSYTYLWEFYEADTVEELKDGLRRIAAKL